MLWLCLSNQSTVQNLKSLLQEYLMNHLNLNHLDKFLSLLKLVNHLNLNHLDNLLK
jgi:hypothetical protein